MQAAPDQKKTRPLAPSAQPSQTAAGKGSGGLSARWAAAVAAGRSCACLHACEPTLVPIPRRSQASKAPLSMEADSMPHLQRTESRGASWGGRALHASAAACITPGEEAVAQPPPLAHLRV